MKSLSRGSSSSSRSLQPDGAVALLVRAAEGDEVDSACSLWHRAEAARTGRQADPAETREFAVAMREAVAKPGAWLLVGLLDGALVASVYGVPLRADPTKAQVAMLAVEPRLWGQGIGTRLLQALTDTLRGDGCFRLRMNVDPANHRARALYERQGWRHLGETEQVPGAREPELIYRADLASADAT
jgi:RimJ/RimL family protein N-acetyltransferase